MAAISIRKKKYDKSNLTSTIRITGRLFFVCSSCLFTFSLSLACTRLSRNAHLIYGFHYLPISLKIFANMLHLSFSTKFKFSARKCHQNVVAKSTELVDIIEFAWNNVQPVNTRVVLEWELTLNPSGRARKIGVFLQKKIV